jgi:hypothetical protein
MLSLEFSYSGGAQKAGKDFPFGSCLHFVCDHALGLLASITPKPVRVSGRPPGRLSRLVTISLQVSLSLGQKGKAVPRFPSLVETRCLMSW